MLEENSETGTSVLGVADVDLVTAVMLPHIADVETTCSVAHMSRVPDVTCASTLHLIGEWVCIVVMFAPEVRICRHHWHHLGCS